MNYRKLGKSGLKVSSIALGTDNFANPTPEDEVARMVDVALDAGINLFDSSDMYAGGECESIIGRALKKNGRRNDVVLATKVHYPTGPGPNDSGNSRLHIMSACEASLKRMQVDHIDLYQLHRPSPDSRRTTCSTAASRTNSCRCAGITGWASSRGRRWRWASSPAAMPMPRKRPTTRAPRCAGASTPSA